MPHVPGHIEEDQGFAPMEFPADEGFAPMDFGVGQGRTQQKFVPDNNSIVNMPATSSASFAARESKEFIEGQEGFFGNTSTTELFELLGAPGGLIDVFVTRDIKKLPGGIIRDFVGTVTGALRERVILGLQEREPTGEFFEGKEIPAFPDPLLDVFIKKNPELAQRFNEKMLDLQEANEDFLIRNGLMFGPNDQPTVLGNALSQAGTSGTMIASAIYLRDPRIPALTFGAIQQVAGFEEALEAGKDPATAADIGLVQGAIEAGVSLIGVGRLVNIVSSKAISIPAKIIASMGVEGIEEGVTEALIIAVQNATGVKDLSLEEALIQIFQATFYGSLIGGGTTTTISTAQAVVERIVGDTVSPEDTTKLARIMDDVGEETAAEVVEQDIDDASTELEIVQDGAAEQTVTKAAKTTAKQQERVVEIMTAMNEGREFDVRQALDEINPEVRVQREKQKLEESKRASVRAVNKQAIRNEVVQLQAEFQIAEQQGNEEEAARISERIDRLHRETITDVTLREAAEELEAEGIFPQGEVFFEQAATQIENAILRAGVRVGRKLQADESAALQDSLTEIVDNLGKKTRNGKPILDPEKLLALQKKVRKATTIASAERIRREILTQARRSAFQKFIRERRAAIDKTIKRNTKPDVGELDADSQNSLDSMKKMRSGMNKAAGDKDSVDDFNLKQSSRIQKDMGQGIPPEGVALQVRYLDILNEKSKATPQAIASFEDDLNAFIETGKGRATASDAKDKELMDVARRQAFSNDVKDLRADIENSTLVEVNEKIDFFLRTHETIIRAMGLKGTVFDVIKEEIRWREEIQLRMQEMQALADEARADGDGKRYLRELSGRKGNVIDVLRKGHTAELGGNQSKRVKWNRGQLISAKMLLMEKSIEKQIRNPEGKMAWTDKLVNMIDERLTDEDRIFINGMFDIYRRSYVRFNEAYRDVYNRDLTFVEFYSHISREGKDGKELSAHTETVLIDTLDVEKSPESLIFPSRTPSEAKSRVDASSEIRILNVADVFRNYNYDVEHFIAFGKILSLQDKLLRDKKFTNRLRETLGRAGFENFLEHVKLIARTNQRSKDADSIVDDLFEFFRANFFKETLLANPKIGLGQTATVLAGKAGMPKKNYTFGVADYSAHPRRANKTLDKHPTFKNRELNFNPEIEQVGGFDRVLKFLNLPSRKGDGWAVRASAWAKFRWLTEEKGVSEKDALDQVAEFAEISQQSTLLTQRTLAQKSDDPLIRTLTMFSSSPVAMANVSIQSIIEYRQSDTSTPQKKSAARNKLYETLAIQNIYIPALYAFLTGRSVATVAGGSLGGAPIIGGVLQVVAEIALNVFRDEDEKVFTKGVIGDIPLSEAIDSILEAARRLSKGDATIEDYVDASVTIAEVFKGFPAGNLVNMYEGAMGLFDTDDPIDAALQTLNYGDAARERTLNRLDAVTGGEPEPRSGRVLTQGAF